jgi:hypothetical protein
MIETLMPYAGTITVLGIAWFILRHDYQQYKSFDKFGVNEFFLLVPRLVLISLPILGTGIFMVFWLFGFRF